MHCHCLYSRKVFSLSALPSSVSYPYGEAGPTADGMRFNKANNTNPLHHYRLQEERLESCCLVEKDMGVLVNSS